MIVKPLLTVDDYNKGTYTIYLGTNIDWTQAYALIGKFVVQFEKLTEAIRQGCYNILTSKGLSEKGLAEIIFHSQVYTADPLFIIYRNMLLHSFPSSTKMKKQLTELATKMGEAVKDRNILLHGTYHIGDEFVELTSNEKHQEIHFEKRVSRQGLINVVSIKTLAELEGYINRVDAIYWDIVSFDKGVTSMLLNPELNPDEIL